MQFGLPVVIVACLYLQQQHPRNATSVFLPENEFAGEYDVLATIFKEHSASLICSVHLFPFKHCSINVSVLVTFCNFFKKKMR